LPKKATLDKGDCIIFNSFCTSKEIVIRIKKHPKESEKILTSYSMNEGLISRIPRAQRTRLQKNKKIQ
jgi:hypothetical protein